MIRSNLLKSIALLFFAATAFAQTSTPTPTNTPAPTPTPDIGDMFGRRGDPNDSSKAYRLPYSRTSHVVSEGISIVEPQETRVYDPYARPFLDYNGQFKADILNLLTNVEFEGSILPWTGDAQMTETYDSDDSDIGSTASGSMQCVADGVATATAQYDLSDYIEKGDFYTFGARITPGTDCTISLLIESTSPEQTFTKSYSLLAVDGAWQLVSVTAKLPDDCYIEAVEFNTDDAVTFHVDNVGVFRSGFWPGFSPALGVLDATDSYSDFSITGDFAAGGSITAGENVSAASLVISGTSLLTGEAEIIDASIDDAVIREATISDLTITRATATEILNATHIKAIDASGILFEDKDGVDIAIMKDGGAVEFNPLAGDQDFEWNSDSLEPGFFLDATDGKAQFYGDLYLGAIEALSLNSTVIEYGNGASVTGHSWKIGGAEKIKITSDGTTQMGVGGLSNSTTKFNAYRDDTSTTPIGYFEQDGTGDAALAWALSGTFGYAFGIDNSDSDKLKLALGSSLGNGTNDKFTMTTGGLIGIAHTSPDTALDISGAITARELSTAPTDPDEGSAVFWMSNGSAGGEDGDVFIKGTAGGNTRTRTIYNHDWDPYGTADQTMITVGGLGTAPIITHRYLRITANTSGGGDARISVGFSTGDFDGQPLTIYIDGDSTDTAEILDGGGSGSNLAGNFTGMGPGDSITLHWDSDQAAWIEDCRSNN